MQYLSCTLSLGTAVSAAVLTVGGTLSSLRSQDRWEGRVAIASRTQLQLHQQPAMRQRHVPTATATTVKATTKTTTPSTASFNASSSPLLICATLAAYLALLTLVTHTINSRVPSPYMDEPFHYNQTAAYCHSPRNFTHYDPKITTFPGLYLASLALSTPLSYLTTAVDWCSLPLLRYYNLIWAGLAFVLYERVLWHVRPASTQWRRLLATLQFALLPLSFVYVPLYYTDTISTAAVLLAFYSAVSQPGISLHPSHSLLSSPLAQLLTALLAVLTRQTNVVWIAYTAGYILVHRSITQHGGGGVRGSESSRSVGGLVESVGRVLRACDARLWPYALVGAVFAAFLVWNGGSVVLGDKSNHTFTLHLAQLLYLSLTIAGLFAIRLVTSTTPATLLSTLLNPHHRTLLTTTATLTALTAATILAVRYTTVLHPFLLSDNRHATFYFARYVLRLRPLLRYGVVPLYVGAMWVVDGLMGRQPLLLRVGWWVCSGLTVGLTPLLELRYFVLPIVMFMLLVEGGGGQLEIESVTVASESRKGVDVVAERERWWLLGSVGQVLWFAVLDAALLYVFIFRPFTWGDGTTARFML